MKNMEIERKWLCNTEKALSFIEEENLEKVYITQVYLKTGVQEERIRRTISKGNNTSYIRTKKEGFGLSRVEIEEPSTKEDFEVARGINPTISKFRYFYQGFEIDVYSDLNLNPETIDLITCEKEFSTEEEAHNFKIELPFIEKEITGDKKYSNSEMANRG